jgi:hypothetical protein
MKIVQRRRFTLLIVASIAWAAPPISAQTTSPLIATIAVPGAPLEAFDISRVDPSTQE